MADSEAVEHIKDGSGSGSADDTNIADSVESVVQDQNGSRKESDKMEDEAGRPKTSVESGELDKQALSDKETGGKPPEGPGGQGKEVVGAPDGSIGTGTAPQLPSDRPSDPSIQETSAAKTDDQPATDSDNIETSKPDDASTSGSAKTSSSSDDHAVLQSALGAANQAVDLLQRGLSDSGGDQGETGGGKTGKGTADGNGQGGGDPAEEPERAVLNIKDQLRMHKEAIRAGKPLDSAASDDEADDDTSKVTQPQPQEQSGYGPQTEHHDGKTDQQEGSSVGGGVKRPLPAAAEPDSQQDQQRASKKRKTQLVLPVYFKASENCLSFLYSAVSQVQKKLDTMDDVSNEGTTYIVGAVMKN